MSIPAEWLSITSLESASDVQRILASRVITKDKLSPIQLIGGMDVSHNPYDPSQLIYATAVVLDKENWVKRAESGIVQKQAFPYIPGFLGFREAPALIQAFQALPLKPDVILVDGHGISHPRQLGIASHIGVLLDIPAIGVAKSILVGHPAGTLGSLKGDQVPLIWKGKEIARVLRTKAKCLPLIISSGHRISLETAVKIALECLQGYRLPEPTRQAHLLANQLRKTKS